MLAVAVFTSTLNSRIRDQEKLRTENEKERMRGNLLRAISHDLRNNHSLIYGSSSTLISKHDVPLGPSSSLLLGEIRGESEWLASIRMVENLLFVTRIDGAAEVAEDTHGSGLTIDSAREVFKKYPNQKVITCRYRRNLVDIPMDRSLLNRHAESSGKMPWLHAKGTTESTLRFSVIRRYLRLPTTAAAPDDALQKSSPEVMKSLPRRWTEPAAKYGDRTDPHALPSCRRTAARLLRKIGRALAVRYSALLLQEGKGG